MDLGYYFKKDEDISPASPVQRPSFIEMSLVRANSFAPALLRWGLSLVFLWFGTTQLANSAGWVSYLPEFLLNTGIDPTLFIFANGLMEVLLGLFLLFGSYVRISALVLGAHLLGIAGTVGVTAVGVRDFGLGFATLAIAFYGADAFSLDTVVKKSERIQKSVILLWAYHAFLVFLSISSVAYALVTYTQSPSFNQIVPAGQEGVLSEAGGIETTIPEATTPTGSSGTPTAILSLQTVATHNTKTNCWIVVSKKVYNVTEYIPFHPGGAARIEGQCGKDATNAFDTKGGTGEAHSSNAKTLLAKYYVGTIGDALSKTSPSKTQTNTTPATTQTTPNTTPTQTVTQPKTPTQPPIQQTTLPVQTSLGLTTATISTHNTQSSCWIIVSGKVYDVTQYIPFHPGGINQISSRCGTDATNAFETKGGTGSTHTSNARSLLAGYYIGDAGAAQTAVPTTQPPQQTTTTPPPPPTTTTPPPPTTTTTLTSAEVATHNTQSNCWLIISGRVYNVTQYIPIHPGGTNRIVSNCGTDATNAFETRGGSGTHSANARNLLAGYYLGDLNTTTTTTGGTTSGGTTGGGTVSSSNTISVSRNSSPNPSTLTISKGTTVTFRHTGGDEVILVFSPKPPNDIKLDNENSSKTYTFTQAGTYTYHYKEGGGNGTIIVQ